jgi:diguanylate cyclase (GGDEF)-like protein
MAKPTAILTQHILSQIVDLVDLPVLLLDASTDSLSVVLANPACQELLRDLCGKHDNLVLAELLDEGTPSPDPTQIVTELEGGREMRLRLRAGEGGAMAAPMLRLLPLRDKTGSTTHALGLIEASVAPVGQRRMRDAAEAANTAETAVDRVTGLLLPASFAAKYSASWETACENAAAAGVMVFRIDEFDKYVATFGKQAANSARRLVGHAIGGSLRRADDLAARLDSDEFAGSITGAEADDVTALAARIVSRVVALCIHHPRSDVTRYLSVSAGVYASSPAGGLADEALEKARQRAARARAEGGNQVIDRD